MATAARRWSKAPPPIRIASITAGADPEQDDQPAGAEAALVHVHPGHRRFEGGGGHRRVVEAGDAEAEHQRGGAAAGEAEAEAGAAELHHQVEGGERGAEGDQQGEGDERRRSRRSSRSSPSRPSRGSASRRSPGPRKAAAEKRLRRPASGRATTESAITAPGDRDEHREDDEAEVVGDRHRHLQGEHADEVHRPDAEADGDAAGGEPAAAGPAGGAGAALGEVEGEVGGDDRDGDRERDQASPARGSGSRDSLPLYRQRRSRK